MDAPRRTAALAGIAAGLLWNFGQSGFDSGPEVGRASAGEIAAFYASGATAPRIGAIVGGIVFVLFLVFLSGLRVRLAPARDDVVAFVFAAGITVAIFYLIGITAVAAPLVRPLERYDDAFVTSMHTLRAFGEQFVFSMIPRVALIGSVSLVILRDRQLPRWLAVVGLVFAGLAAVGVLRFLFTPTHALFGVFDAMSILSNYTLPLWIILTSATMLRSSPAARTA